MGFGIVTFNFFLCLYRIKTKKFENKMNLSIVFKYKTKQKKKVDVLLLYSLSMFTLDGSSKECKLVWYKMGLWKSHINFKSLMRTI